MPVQEDPCPTLTVPSDMRMLSLARAFVEAVCAAQHVDKETIQAVILATGEAVTNVVRHAYRSQPGSPFHVECRVNPDSVHITLIDHGEIFDLQQVPQLAPGELRVGGRGVFLMRALMDEVSCQRLGEAGNRLHLIKKRPASDQVRNCG